MLFDKLKDKLKESTPTGIYERNVMAYEFLKEREHYISAVTCLLKNLSVFKKQSEIFNLIVDNFEDDDFLFWNKYLPENENRNYLKATFASTVSEIIWSQENITEDNNLSNFNENYINDVSCTLIAIELKLKPNHKNLNTIHEHIKEFIRDIKWRPINCLDSFIEMVYEYRKQELKNNTNKTT